METGEKSVKGYIAKHVKVFFLYLMIGSLSLAALIAIVAVLLGTWNDYVVKALLITASIMIHGLLALGFISADSHIRNNHADIFINTLFGVLVGSFITTVFSILDVIPPESLITFKIYLWLIGVVAAGGLATLISNASREDKTTRRIANVSVGTLVLMMIQFFPLVLSKYINFEVGGGIYYRVLIALSILFGVTAVLTVIFHRLYRVKHPLMVKDANGQMVAKKGIPGWAIALIVTGIVLFGWPIIVLVGALITMFITV